MKINHVFIIIALFISTISCQGQDNIQLPSWAIGTWEGEIGFEHDIIEYKVSIDLDDSANIHTMYLMDDGAKFQLVLDSVSEQTVRFQIKPMSSETNLTFKDGIIDLSKIDYFPDSLIHAQLYPLNINELWLGQLKKKQK